MREEGRVRSNAEPIPFRISPAITIKIKINKSPSPSGGRKNVALGHFHFVMAEWWAEGAAKNVHTAAFQPRCLVVVVLSPRLLVPSGRFRRAGGTRLLYPTSIDSPRHVS